MASQRTLERIACLKSYVISKVCTQPECRRVPAPGSSLCIFHRDRKRRYGLPTAKPLGPLQRRSYVRGYLTVIRKELRKAENITILSAVNELDSFLANQCTYIPMADIANRGLGADRKLRGLLKNIHRRWPQENRAAVNILASVLGAWLAVEVEAVEKHPRYLRAAIFSAVFSLALTPPTKRIIERNGKSMMVKVRKRPYLSGRRIHEALDKHVTQKLARYIFESKALRKAVLELVIKHNYKVHYWA